MDFSSIHNYYEHLVTNYLHSKVIPTYDDKTDDYFLDIACYALSKLPARYMRHEIDMAFYLDSNERSRMDTEVEQAIKEAINYIDENFNRDNRYEMDE
jgi:hypothetical protein